MRILLLLFVILLSTKSTLATNKKITLIANLSASISQSFSRKKIKDIYLLKQRVWPDEKPIIVVNRKADSHLRQLFEQKLGINNKKYALYLKKMHYKGIRLPIIQNSKKAVLAFVNNVPGTVAYIEGQLPENYPHIKWIGQL